MGTGISPAKRQKFQEDLEAVRFPMRKFALGLGAFAAVAAVAFMTVRGRGNTDL